MFKLFSIFSILILSLMSPALAEQQCLNLFAEQWNKSRVAFTAEQHQRHFWEIHERFGFLKTEDGKTFLIARDLNLAETIFQELMDAFSVDSDQVRRVFEKDRLVPDSIAIDVSSVLPKTIQDSIDSHPDKKGPNCWNLCLVNAQVIPALRKSSPDEFAHWTRSSFVKKLNSPEELRLNDVIAFHRGTDEIHAAIYILANVVWSKNGIKQTSGYMLMDLKDLMTEYGQLSTELSQIMRLKPKTISYLRLKSLAEIVAAMPNGLPELLSRTIEKFDTIESGLQNYYFQNQPQSAELDLFKVRVRNFSIQQLELIDAQIAALKGARTRQARSELHLWKALRQRLLSFPAF